jgi:hypothetical protein
MSPVWIFFTNTSPLGVPMRVSPDRQIGVGVPSFQQRRFACPSRITGDASMQEYPFAQSLSPVQLPSVFVGGGVEAGQGANSQLGAVRPTYEPSGHIFASMVHATMPPSVLPPPSYIGAGVAGGTGFPLGGIAGAGYSPGHAANSQLGPVRPTAEPSGHIFASMVQAIPCSKSGDFGGAVMTVAITHIAKTAKKEPKTRKIIFSFVSIKILYHLLE